ncbi:MAG: BLUF domain-containing protein [Opitutaceae bacterium]
MEQLIHLIYVSSAKKPFTEQELKDLLLVARKANKEHEITGLLLYKDGNFMQVIEGERADIEQLTHNIEHDQTHTGMIVLLKESIQQRDFSDWTMGFQNLSSEKIEGFSDFLSTSTEDSLLPGKAKKLLMSFKKV